MGTFTAQSNVFNGFEPPYSTKAALFSNYVGAKAMGVRLPSKKRVSSDPAALFFEASKRRAEGKDKFVLPREDDTQFHVHQQQYKAPPTVSVKDVGTPFKNILHNQGHTQPKAPATKRDVLNGARAVSYGKVYASTTPWIDEMCETHEKINRCDPFYVSHANPLLHQSKLNGDAVLHELKTDFMRFGMTPSSMQMKIAEACWASMQKLIYNDEYDMNKQAILRNNGWDELPGILGILTSRRAGKTTVMSMVAACAMFNIPNCKIVVVSKTLRQSIQLMTMVKASVKDHPKFASCKVTADKAMEMIIEGPDGTTRSLKALPGDSDVSLFFSVHPRVVETGGFVCVCVWPSQG
jgi:hypothetical protein